MPYFVGKFNAGDSMGMDFQQQLKLEFSLKFHFLKPISPQFQLMKEVKYAIVTLAVTF